MSKRYIRFSVLGLLVVAVVFGGLILRQPKTDRGRIEFRGYDDEGKALFAYIPPHQTEDYLLGFSVDLVGTDQRESHEGRLHHGTNSSVALISLFPWFPPTNTVWRIHATPLVPSKGMRGIWERMYHAWRTRSLKSWHPTPYHTLGPVFSEWITNDAPSTVSNSVTQARH